MPFRKNRRFNTLSSAQKNAEYDRACNFITGKNSQVQKLKFALMCALSNLEEERWNPLPLRPVPETLRQQLDVLQTDIQQRNFQPIDLGCVACKIFYKDEQEARRPIVFRCGHHMCGECAIAWLTQNNTCPTCRTVVTDFIMLYH